MNKFIFIKTKLENCKTFNKTKFIRSNIIFSQNNFNVVLHLKKNKMNVKHRGVKIIITTINNFLYSILAFCKSFMLDFLPNNILLFNSANRTRFVHNLIIEIFC